MWSLFREVHSTEGFTMPTHFLPEVFEWYRHKIVTDVVLRHFQGSVAKKKIKCPTCRKGFSVPHGGIDGFPTNFLINNLLLVLDKQEAENKVSR